MAAKSSAVGGGMPDIILRPYQVESIEEMRNNFRVGHIRQVLASSTGSGKSVMMVALIKSAVEKSSRVLFICERRILVEQFSRHLDVLGVDHGILMAGSWRFRPQALVQVASAQTLERMASWPEFDIAFIDELHACMRKSVVDMIEKRPNLKIVGATATPFHPAISKHFTAVSNVITMKQLVDNGSLVSFRVFVAKEIDTRGVKVVAGEWKKDDLERRGQQIVGDIVSDYVRLSNEVFGGYRKTICFSCGVAHGADLVERFNAVGINAVQISYKDDNEYKADVLADFAKSDTSIQVVISSDILTRGYDQTDVEHVILARPLKKSFSSHVQMVGRGARPHEGKKFCVIQDHAGNWLRFQKAWDELYNDGIKELSSAVDEKPKPEPTDKEKEAAKCPQCGALWPGKSDICFHCGYERPRRNEVIEQPGELQELSGKKAEKYDGAYKEEWYQALIGELQSRGKNINRAYHLYIEMFGVKPAWEKKPRSIMSKAGLDAFNYLKKSNIAWAKRNHAR